MKSTYNIDFQCCLKVSVRTRGKFDAIRQASLLLSFFNIVLNPLIYIFQYDVVRRSLVEFAQKIAAKFKSQQPPTTS